MPRSQVSVWVGWSGDVGGAGQDCMLGCPLGLPRLSLSLNVLTCLSQQDAPSGRTGSVVVWSLAFGVCLAQPKSGFLSPWTCLGQKVPLGTPGAPVVRIRFLE